MQPAPPPPPNEKKPTNWPVLVNLVALVGAVVLLRDEPGALVPVIVFLMLVNVLAAVLAGLFNRLHWVAAFALSALLVPLIGLGTCALIIQMNGGLHLGH